MTNPYKPPEIEKRYQKYQEPLVNWKLLFLALGMIYGPLLFLIILQILFYEI